MLYHKSFVAASVEFVALFTILIGFVSPKTRIYYQPFFFQDEIIGFIILMFSQTLSLYLSIRVFFCYLKNLVDVKCVRALDCVWETY